MGWDEAARRSGRTAEIASDTHAFGLVWAGGPFTASSDGTVHDATGGRALAAIESGMSDAGAEDVFVSIAEGGVAVAIGVLDGERSHGLYATVEDRIGGGRGLWLSIGQAGPLVACGTDLVPFPGDLDDAVPADPLIVAAVLSWLADPSRDISAMASSSAAHADDFSLSMPGEVPLSVANAAVPAASYDASALFSELLSQANRVGAGSSIEKSVCYPYPGGVYVKFGTVAGSRPFFTVSMSKDSSFSGSAAVFYLSDFDSGSLVAARVSAGTSEGWARRAVAAAWPSLSSSAATMHSLANDWQSSKLAGMLAGEGAAN